MTYIKDLQNLLTTITILENDTVTNVIHTWAMDYINELMEEYQQLSTEQVNKLDTDTRTYLIDLNEDYEALR